MIHKVIKKSSIYIALLCAIFLYEIEVNNLSLAGNDKPDIGNAKIDLIQEDGLTMIFDDIGDFDLSGNWVVLKFTGQIDGSAGIAFPDTSRIPPIDIILANGLYLRDKKNLRNFVDNVKNNGGTCFVVKKKYFDQSGFDKRIFEGF